jgi:hypothetical protein
MTDPVADAIEDAIEAAVDEPQQVSVEGESITNRSIPDLIALAKYRGAQNAVNSSNPISCRRQKFPGASGLQPPRC